MPKPGSKILESLADWWAKRQGQDQIGKFPFGPPNAIAGLGMPLGPRVEASSGFGDRPDGRPKGLGWLGVLPRPDGGVSTELSAGVQIRGKEIEIPLLVPTLSQEEVNWLLNAPPHQQLPRSIIEKAYDHAEQRIALGLSPFAD